MVATDHEIDLGPSQAFKVALVATTYSPIPGGMEIYLERIAKGLVKLGHKVQVVTRFTIQRPLTWKKVVVTSEQPRTYSDENVQVVVIAHPRWLRPILLILYRLQYYKATVGIFRWIGVRSFHRQLLSHLGDCDIIHYSGNGQDFLASATMSAANELSIPLVVTPHTHAGAWGDGETDYELYRIAQQTIALTEDERQRLVDGGLPENRVSVVPHAAEVSPSASGDRFREKHGLSGPIVLFLGRKTAAKGYGLLLEAIPYVWDECPDANFVFAGPTDPTEEYRFDLPPDHRVFDLGFLSDTDRDDAYSAADVFCLPSAHEAFGLVYCEAWTFGTPVVGLRIPTLEEIIERTGGGILAEHNPRSVADAISELLSDPSLRKKLGEAGRAKVQVRKWRNVATETIEVYHKAQDSLLGNQQ